MKGILKAAIKWHTEEEEEGEEGEEGEEEGAEEDMVN